MTAKTIGTLGAAEIRALLAAEPPLASGLADVDLQVQPNGIDLRVDRLQRLRHTLAGMEVPLTLERAPWTLRGAVGHFGAYREGVGPLVAGLRRTFDPGGALVVATEGS